MEIEERILGHVAVLRIRQEAQNASDAAAFHEMIRDLVKRGVCNVVVDASGGRWARSPMLGALISGLTTLRLAGGDLRLAALTRRMGTILASTGLERIFRAMDSVESAVSSFET
jgi:anti-sigma B factor antagonist